MEHIPRNIPLRNIKLVIVEPRTGEKERVIFLSQVLLRAIACWKDPIVSVYLSVRKRE